MNFCCLKLCENWFFQNYCICHEFVRLQISSKFFKMLLKRVFNLLFLHFCICYEFVLFLIQFKIIYTKALHLQWIYGIFSHHNFYKIFAFAIAEWSAKLLNKLHFSHKTRVFERMPQLAPDILSIFAISDMKGFFNRSCYF